MPRINVLPPFSGGKGEDRSDAVFRAAECAEMVKCAEILSALRLKVAALCRECGGTEEDVEQAAEAFEREVREKSAEVAGEKASLFIRDVCSELREDLMRRCVETEVLSSLAGRTNALADSIKDYADYLKDFPQAYGDVCSDFEESVKASGLPAAVKETLYAQAVKKFAESILESAVGLHPDASEIVFADARVSEIFSKTERELLKNLTQKRRDARDAYTAFQRLKRSFSFTASDDLEKLIAAYSDGLSDAAAAELRVLAAMYFDRETKDEQARTEERLRIVLSEIKKTFEEKGAEEAFALLVSGETESLNAALYKDIRAAFESGLVGLPDGKKGFLSILKDFSQGKGFSEKDLLSAYLTGKTDLRGSDVLSFLCTLSVGDADVFFFRRALGALIEKAEENYAAAASEAVIECFAFARNNGASLSEIKTALDACIGG